MKKIFALASLFLLMAPAFAFADESPPEDLFSDVSWGDEGYWEIANLKFEGIISGYSDGSFRPNNTVNRAEFSKIVSIAAWNHDPETDTLGDTLPFSDVRSYDWFEPYVHKLYIQNVISGYSDGTFKPENTINFAEAAKVLVNTYECYVNPEGYDSWWEPYATKLNELEVIPESILNYSPWYTKELTRVEMAELVSNMEDIAGDDRDCP